MIHLDTSALIGCFAGNRPLTPRFAAFVRRGERSAVCAPVLYEWWRGPRTSQELRDQESLFPQADAVAFGVREATLAAEIYRVLKQPRRRELDIAIAACAVAHGAAFWTLNPQDFDDIPGLELAAP